MENNRNTIFRGHRIIILVVLCLFGFCLIWATSLTSHAPRKQAKDDRVYLIHADELRYDMRGLVPDAQILRGKVHFTHGGSHLWCDSAYFFQASESVQAFGNVRFTQGDTLSLTCDNADYDGMEQVMRARNNVVMKHRTQTLYTDSLDYDRVSDLAYFFEGGKLIDGNDRLVSDWGEYSPSTRLASFYYAVQMYSGKNHITTDTLHYDTRTSVAHVTGPSTLTSGESVVYTTDAYMNSRTDRSSLYSRSTICNGGKFITGDSLYHDNKSGDSEGYGHVVYTDTVSRQRLLCHRMRYNANTGYGYATDSAVVEDYSQQDTLWMHADTLKLYTYNINTDSVSRTVHAYKMVRAYRKDLQAVCDSLVFATADSCLTMYGDPIAWNVNRQLLGEVIKVYMNDSTVRKAEIIGQAMTVEQTDTLQHYNQLSSNRIDAFFKDGVVRRTDAVANVKTLFYNADDKDSVLTELNYLETDTLRMFLSAERKLERIWVSRCSGTMYPMSQIPPEMLHLPGFVWFDYIRPKNRDDIFVWRGKDKGDELKVIRRREVPLLRLSRHDTDAEGGEQEPE